MHLLYHRLDVSQFCLLVSIRRICCELFAASMCSAKTFVSGSGAWYTNIRNIPRYRVLVKYRGILSGGIDDQYTCHQTQFT